MGDQIAFASIGETILLAMAQEVGDVIVNYLKEIGLTDDEIRFLDKQGALFYWYIILNDYITMSKNNNYYHLYNITILTAKIMIPYVDDRNTRENMDNFVNCPSIYKAEEIMLSIDKEIHTDYIMNLLEKIIKFLINDTNTQTKSPA